MEVGNMGGLPMFVKDDYIYIYFNDHCKDGSRKWISAARMKLSESKGRKTPDSEKVQRYGQMGYRSL